MSDCRRVVANGVGGFKASLLVGERFGERSFSGSIPILKKYLPDTLEGCGYTNKAHLRGLKEFLAQIVGLCFCSPRLIVCGLLAKLGCSPFSFFLQEILYPLQLSAFVVLKDLFSRAASSISPF